MTRFDDARIGESRLGDSGDQLVRPGAFQNPWRLGTVRIEGITGPIPAFQAGATDAIACVFADVEGAADHVQRYEAIRSYRRYANGVHTYPAEGFAYFRQDAPAAPDHQLALLAPIEPTSTGSDPTPRASTAAPMWVVITNVEDETTLPEAVAELTVEFTMIARYADHQTRASVRDVAEVPGYGLE